VWHPLSCGVVILKATFGCEGLLKNICETVTVEAPLSVLGRHLGKALRGISLLFLSPYMGIARNRQ
jgi:hypothetical protein